MLKSQLNSFKKFSLIYLLNLAFYISFAFAQNPELFFWKLSRKNGLSNNAVKSIFQDKRGFMWFGTINGLNRFDGKEFVVFSHNTKDNKSISNDFINCITEDDNQNLWIGSAKGVNKYSPKTGEFYNYNNNPEQEYIFTQDYITTLKITSDKKIWIGTRNRGVLRYDTKLNKLDAIQLNKIEISAPVIFINEDINKNIWVGTTEGLYRISINNNLVVKTEKLLDVYVNLIYTDKTKNLWIGTTAGLYKLPNSQLLSSQKSSFINYTKTGNNNSISHNDVTAIYEDNEGELWLGTDGGGLNRSKSDKELDFLHYQNKPDNPNSLSQNQIFAITQDFSGVIWIATNDGVNKLKKSIYPFIHFQSNTLKSNSLENNNLATIENIIIDGKEYMLCGSTGGAGLGLISSNDVHRDYENFIRFKDESPTLNTRKYQSFLILSPDSLLIGTKSGLRLFNLKTKSFVALTNTLNKIPRYVVRKIHKDGNGLIWMGTSNGLFIWNPATDNLIRAPLENKAIDDNDYRSFVERSSLSNIFAIAEDGENNIWVGTWGGGLLKFNANFPQKKPVRFTNNDSPTLLTNNYVVSLLYTDSKLWIGSANGLCYLIKPEEANSSIPFKNIHLTKDSKKIHVSGILEDHHKNLWLATINGIINTIPPAKQLIFLRLRMAI
nr:two-component regulator propeller domain-containing protein [uncultured Pedobacter sp.]